MINPRFARHARERREAFTRTPWPPVRFSSVQTAIGTVFVGVSDQGVVDVAFGLRDEAAYRKRLARRAPEVRNDRAGTLRSVIAEIEAYFAGMLRDFSVPVDLQGVTPFTAKVLRETQAIPYGTLVSYGELARRLGASGAARAVGGALGRNPIPVIITLSSSRGARGSHRRLHRGVDQKTSPAGRGGIYLCTGQEPAFVDRAGTLVAQFAADELADRLTIDAPTSQLGHGDLHHASKILG